MSVGLYHFIALAMFMFLIGSLGVILRRNALIVLMSLEMMLNAANLAMIAFARFHGSEDAHAIVLLFLGIAAAEVTIGLAIIVKIYRERRNINVDLLTSLKR